MNEVLDDQARINRMRSELSELQRQLAEERKLRDEERGGEANRDMQEKLDQERLEKEEMVKKVDKDSSLMSYKTFDNNTLTFKRSKSCKKKCWSLPCQPQLSSRLPREMLDERPGAVQP